ncbi:YbaB/EbfC family nucleoid-associated protein [Streptomyces sp. NPDC007856]|uniref:YbaB/EbfC family nucleoid-associated protein n=1 Tax=Streptomyces sp. NPDC007856 TaxID=3364781 RepID=UPI0036BA017D
MDASPVERLAQLLADFADQYGALTRARAQMETLVVTAQSRDGAVEATVSVGGGVPTVRYISKRCKEMSDAELSASILEALATARAEAAIRITALKKSTESRLPVFEAPVIRNGPHRGAAARRMPVQEGPGRPDVRDHLTRRRSETCWSDVVWKARMVTAGASSTQGTVMSSPLRRPVVPDRATLRETTERPHPQTPLWGRNQPVSRPVSQSPALPAELRNAVIALGGAICGSTVRHCMAAAYLHRDAPAVRGHCPAAVDAT